MRREKSAAMFPEQGPDLFYIRLWQRQSGQLTGGKEGKRSFAMPGRERFEFRLHFKQKHEPMRLAGITMLAHNAGKVEVFRGDRDSKFFCAFAAGTGIGRFASDHVELATTRTPETAIGILRAFEQENFVAFIEAIEQRGDFVGQARHNYRTFANSS